MVVVLQQSAACLISVVLGNNLSSSNVVQVDDAADIHLLKTLPFCNNEDTVSTDKTKCSVDCKNTLSSATIRLIYSVICEEINIPVTPRARFSGWKYSSIWKLSPRKPSDLSSEKCWHSYDWGNYLFIRSFTQLHPPGCVDQLQLKAELEM